MSYSRRRVKFSLLGLEYNRVIAGKAWGGAIELKTNLVGVCLILEEYH